MSDVAAELSVLIAGKETGLKTMLAEISSALKKADADAQKAAGSIGGSTAAATQKAARDAIGLAQGYARLANASGDTAEAIQILRNAIEQNGAAGEKVLVGVQAQIAGMERQADRAKQSGLAWQKFSTEAAGAAASMISLGAIVGTTTKVLESFGEAFQFKAELDSTNNSIALQLRGVRDSNQVFAEGQAYADKYKLTQEELTAALQSGVGVMRASTSSTTDLLSTFQRLTVLAPDKPISEAARAIRELQSGDTTSIKELFNISAKDANRMKAEIVGGADAVKVVADYLTSAGVGMDALATRTEGAAGRMRDLAKAQEELKLAQAEFAQGPGMEILQFQIEATRGGTRLLSGDFKDMGASLVQAFADGSPMALALAQSLGVSGAQAQAAAQQYLAHNTAVRDGTSGGTQWGSVLTSNATALAAQANATGTATTAVSAQNQAIGQQLIATTDATNQTYGLAAANTEIAQLGGAVANGLITAANAAAALANQYGITTAEADRLISAQARLAGQKAQTRDNSGSIGFNAPGRSGRSDADIFKTIADTQKANLSEQAAQQQALIAFELDRAKASGDTAAQIAIQKRELDKLTVGSADYIKKQNEIFNLQNAPGRGSRGGGGASAAKTALTAQTTANNQLEDLERQHQEKLAQIAADGDKKRAAADESFRRSQLTGRASFYAGLANVTDAAQQQALAARYEAIQQEANAIKQSQGSDVAQAYAAAAQQALEKQSQIEQQIAEAEKNKDSGKAEYLKGVLVLQKQTDDDELNMIKTKGSAIAAERQKQYADEETDFEAHLDRIGATYERKVAKLPGLKTALGSGPSGLPNPSDLAGQSDPKAAAAGATSNQVQAVADVATPAAVDAQTGRLEGALTTIRDAVNEVASRVTSVERAVGAIAKNNKAFANG